MGHSLIAHYNNKYLTEANDGSSCSQEVEVDNWSLCGRISEASGVVKSTQWLPVVMLQFCQPLVSGFG